MWGYVNFDTLEVAGLKTVNGRVISANRKVMNYTGNPNKDIKSLGTGNDEIRKGVGGTIIKKTPNDTVTKSSTIPTSIPTQTTTTVNKTTGYGMPTSGYTINQGGLTPSAQKAFDYTNSPNRFKPLKLKTMRR